MCCSFFNFFFLRLLLACRLCVIYVREDNDSNVHAVITWLIWTIWTSMSAVPRKAVKFNHSLTHSDQTIDIFVLRCNSCLGLGFIFLWSLWRLCISFALELHIISKQGNPIDFHLLIGIEALFMTTATIRFRLSRIVGLIDMKWKGSKSSGYWSNFVTLPYGHIHDLALECSMSGLEIALSQEWRPIDMEQKRCESIIHGHDHVWPLDNHGGVGGCRK